MIAAGKKIFNGKMDRQVLRTAIYVAFVSLLLGCLVLIVIYRISLRQIKNISQQMAFAQTERIWETLDFQIGTLDNISIEFSLDPDVAMLANEKNVSTSIYYKTLFGITNRMRKYDTLHPLIDTIYIYLTDSGRVIADSSSSYKAYQDVLNITDNSISVIGLHLADDNPAIYDADGKPLPMDQVIRIVRKPWQNAGNYYCVITIQKNSLTMLAEEALADVNGIFWVYDENGSLVFTNAGVDTEGIFTAEKGMEKIDNEWYMLNEVRSDYTNWRIVTAIPNDSFFIGYRNMQIVVGVLFAIVSLLSLSLGFAVAVHASRPLRQLYENIRSRAGGASKTERRYTDRISELAFIYENILDDRKNMKQALEINMPQLRERFLISLLSGESHEDTVLWERMQFIGVVFPYDRFLVAIVDLNMRLKDEQENQYSETELLRISIERTMEEAAQVYSFQYAPGRIVVILNHPGTDTTAVFAGLSGFSGEKQIRNVGVSTSGTGISELPWLFLEAEQTLNYADFFGPGEIICYENINDIPTVQPVYPFDLEQRLLASIRACDEKELQNTVGETGDYLQNKVKTDSYVKRQILRYLAGSVEHLLGELDAFSEEDAKELNRQMDTLDLTGCLSLLEDLSRKAVGAMKVKREGKSQELVNRAFAYIDEHYAEEVTVDDIAASLYISVPYLYKLFKQECDISPMAYLIQVRLQNAAERLRETNQPIGNIALSCGFESIQSFNRQFKKNYGCPPSQYRQNHG